MIVEKKLGTLDELERADWRLRMLADQVAQELERYGYDLALTCVEREPEETRALYAGAGQVPPAASVHDCRPCRGADGVPRISPAGGLPTLDVSVAATRVAAAVNARIRYPRGKRAVLWHDVAGAHLHLQVPPDGLELAAIVPVDLARR